MDLLLKNLKNNLVGFILLFLSVVFCIVRYVVIKEFEYGPLDWFWYTWILGEIVLLVGILLKQKIMVAGSLILTGVLFLYDLWDIFLFYESITFELAYYVFESAAHICVAVLLLLKSGDWKKLIVRIISGVWLLLLIMFVFEVYDGTWQCWFDIEAWQTAYELGCEYGFSDSFMFPVMLLSLLYFVRSVLFIVGIFFAVPKLFDKGKAAQISTEKNMSLEEELRALKHWRENNQISESEYEDKKNEVLKRL